MYILITAMGEEKKGVGGGGFGVGDNIFGGWVGVDACILYNAFLYISSYWLSLLQPKVI